MAGKRPEHADPAGECPLDGPSRQQTPAARHLRRDRDRVIWNPKLAGERGQARRMTARQAPARAGPARHRGAALRPHPRPGPDPPGPHRREAPAPV